MTRQDDELIRRYQEASEQEGARPGTHVRDAVRAHAQMLAAANRATAAPQPAPPGSTGIAANQARWKISALATLAVVGLTGLLMLQFERGTPEERDVAFSQRRAEAPVPAATPISPAPEGPQERAVGSTSTSASPSADAMVPKPTAPAPAAPLAKTPPSHTPLPLPAAADVQAPDSPREVAAVSGFPASPSTAAAPPSERRARAVASNNQALEATAPAPQAAAAAAAPATPRPTADPKARDSVEAAAAPSAQKRLGTSLPDAVLDAARAGNSQQVEVLIHQGAPVDARDNNGKTALMLAAMNGHTPTVQKLLALGANPTLVDRDGQNAAKWAAQQGHTRLADLLEAAAR